MMKYKEISKRIVCMLSHQDHWVGYIIGHPPLFCTIEVCSKCGTRHVSQDSLLTREDIDRKRNEVINYNFEEEDHEKISGNKFDIE